MKVGRITLSFSVGWLNPFNWSFNIIYSNGYDKTFKFGPILIDMKKEND